MIISLRNTWAFRRETVMEIVPGRLRPKLLQSYTSAAQRIPVRIVTLFKGEHQTGLLGAPRLCVHQHQRKPR